MDGHCDYTESAQWADSVKIVHWVNKLTLQILTSVFSIIWHIWELNHHAQLNNNVYSVCYDCPYIGVNSPYLEVVFVIMCQYCLFQCGTNLRIFEYIQIYLDKYIHSFKYLLIFFGANIFGYSFVIYLYWRMYLDIHSSNIYDSKYIWIFIVSKKWLKWLLLVQNSLIRAQNNTKYENGQNRPKQSWANNYIF